VAAKVVARGSQTLPVPYGHDLQLLFPFSEEQPGVFMPIPILELALLSHGLPLRSIQANDGPARLRGIHWK
jgi:hypothetical protein